VDAQLINFKDWGNRRWFINGQGQTFAVIEGPIEFLMGSPPTESSLSLVRSGVDYGEITHHRIIARRFAVATQEVSVKEYQVFVNENPGFDYAHNMGSDPEGPVNGVTWYDAAAYCNWLSRKEGLPECYEPNEGGNYADGMKIKPDALRLRGYRLPTEAEWEYACRAGTETSRYYGASEDLLGRYAWYLQTAHVRLAPCGTLLPNDFGLLDMLGNVCEWCLDVWQPYPKTTISDEINGQLDVNRNPRSIRGGTSGSAAVNVRSAARGRNDPSSRYINWGFRPAITQPD
jgi:formylglycine-generating enzyme required for sulfatase activity